MSEGKHSFRKRQLALAMAPPARRYRRRRDFISSQFVESLEPRCLFNVYTVSNLNDSVLLPFAGSLRQAILYANANPGQDTIEFDFGGGGGGSRTISLVGALPPITDSLIVDGFSQGGPGYTGSPLIRVDGATAPPNNRAFGLLFQSIGNNTVNGLAFTGWDIAIEFDNSAGGVGNNTVTGNYIGLSTDGRSPMGCKYAGLTFIHSNGNTISNNVISANGINTASPGIYLDHSSSNICIGNFIGVSASGTSAMGNGGAGIELGVGSANNRIGTDSDGINDAAECNVISGNGDNGLQICGAGADFNIVAGNLIGADVSGSFAIPNAGAAINVFDAASGNRIGGGNNNLAVTVGSGGSIILQDALNLGSLTLDDGFAGIVTSSRKTISIGALSITGAGLLDIGDNILLVDNGLTPFATLKTCWQAGYNNDSNNGYGLWDGAHGITSSVAKNSAQIDGKITVGYLDGAAQNDFGGTYTDLIGGPALATNQVLFRPALMGDLNLDGFVNGDDIGVIISLGYYGTGAAPHGWLDGDLNGDASVDGNDIGLIISTGTYGSGSFRPLAIASNSTPFASNPSPQPSAQSPDAAASQSTTSMLITRRESPFRVAPRARKHRVID